MGVTMAQDGWFGEGDDFFYVDGEEVPSLQGTGTEDYFNDAWGFRTRSGIWFGQPRWEGYQAGDSGVCYRWHVADPVRFESSLLLAVEHKGNLPLSEDGFFVERPDYLNSVAFWYQAGIAEPAAALPGWPDRNPPWAVTHLLESFQAARVIGGAKPRIACEGMFGGRPMVAWPNRDPGATLTVPFVAPETARYAVRLRAWVAPGNGTFAVEIDGSEAVSAEDLGSGDGGEKELNLGTHLLEGGVHALALRAVGDRAGPLQVETLRLLRLPPEAGRPIKGHNEAHFIRLGIGRALYAYRLAYGELPRSLHELVEAGVMDARYLSDENGGAMTAHIEDGCMVVRAATWAHRWQGLDPRR
jgi:hypothetical protein